MLAFVIVPAISVAVRKFGRYLRELSHRTQAAAAVASSIAEVCLLNHAKLLKIHLSVYMLEDSHKIISVHYF